MRIVCLSTWWPEPADNGSRLRIAQLLDALAQHHEVHLVALAHEQLASLQRSHTEAVCASVRAVPQQARRLNTADRLASLWRSEPASVRAAWNPAFAEQARACVAAVRPDVILAFQLGVAPYAGMFPGVPRVLDELELGYMLEQYAQSRFGLRRLRAWVTWSKHRRYVSRLLRAFDGCTVTSERERELARSRISRAIDFAVVPNGADVAGCAADWGAPEHDTIVYPGALSFSANFDAMAYFLGAIFPLVRAARPNARLRITGEADPQRRAALPPRDGVEFTGYLPDVRPAIARSWCEVVPLRAGGGTRLKVLEALALGTPVVSTSKGIEGLDLEPGRHLLVADTPGEFAAATARLLGDAGLRARLAAAGQHAVRAKYDWRLVGQRLDDLLRAVVARSPEPGQAYLRGI